MCPSVHGCIFVYYIIVTEPSKVCAIDVELDAACFSFCPVLQHFAPFRAVWFLWFIVGSACKTVLVFWCDLEVKNAWPTKIHNRVLSTIMCWYFCATHFCATEIICEFVYNIPWDILSSNIYGTWLIDRDRQSLLFGIVFFIQTQ